MALTHNIADIRKNYSKQALTEESVMVEPIQQFELWLQEAISAEADEPTAFVLSTVNTSGQPAARVVLLKEVNPDGFVFFTNYDSRKGNELNSVPLAAMTFFWASLERQVRVEGSVEKVSEAISDAYFQSRPKGSQIGAWASPQSKEITSRSELEQADKSFTQKFEAADKVPRPPHWGGYIIKPTMVEFWQGRPNRLHDRIVYEKHENSWRLKRLAP